MALRNLSRRKSKAQVLAAKYSLKELTEQRDEYYNKSKEMYRKLHNELNPRNIIKLTKDCEVLDSQIKLLRSAITAKKS